MVDDFEGRNEAEAHAKAEEAASVGHKANQRNLLITLYPRNHRVLKRTKYETKFWMELSGNSFKRGSFCAIFNS
jgi:hypothetical protein